MVPSQRLVLHAGPDSAGPGPRHEHLEKLPAAAARTRGKLPRKRTPASYYSWVSSPSFHLPFRRGSPSEKGSHRPLSTSLIKHEARPYTAGGCQPGHQSAEQFWPIAAYSLLSPGAGGQVETRCPTEQQSPRLQGPDPQQTSFPYHRAPSASTGATITPGDKPLRRSCWSWRHRS